MKISLRITILVTGGALLLTVAALFRHRIDLRLEPEPYTRRGDLRKDSVVRRPPPSASLRRDRALTQVPVYNPKSTRGWQVDLRSYDIRGVDLTNRLADLRQADFDSRTQWPATLPSGFDPRAILELNKNPGLGVRNLHARGIRGRGVGVGIIDQTLLVGHAEYRDRLRSYEELHLQGTEAQMHGPAVASAAVGKNVGVAPDADLHYIACTHGEYSRGGFTYDFSPLAAAIDRLLQRNALLPPDRKLRVISISVGWNPSRKGYRDVMAAVERAARANVFVVSCAVERTHRFAFHGLGREQTSDPDRAESYGPGGWWAPEFWVGHRFEPGTKLLVPMDARTLASPTGDDDYTFYPNGGWSWSVPWLAGLYALACQVRPDITPELFWAEALRTGRTISIRRGDTTAEFGTIADPVALITSLQRAS